MSKTETQSRAESLAKMLEFGAFSPNLLQNEIGVRKGAAAELRRLDAENKALRELLGASPAVPHGFALVPVVPTRRMLDVGRWSGAGSVSIQEEWARKEVWHRMLAAAPQAAAKTGDAA